MPRVLVIDTETGGLNPEVHSILSVGAVVWEDGQLGKELEVFIVEPQLIVDPEALAKNRIDIVKHCEKALAPVDAMNCLWDFLEQNYPELKSGKQVTLVGHNVSFDVSFLKRLCRLADVRFRDLFSHRTIDTASVLRFLMLANKIALTSAGSDEAFKFFGIPIDPNHRHTALGDARATAHLLTCLIEGQTSTTSYGVTPSILIPDSTITPRSQP